MVSPAFGQSQPPQEDPRDPKTLRRNRDHVTGAAAATAGISAVGALGEHRKARRLKREAGSIDNAYSTHRRLDIIPSALSKERIATLERLAGREGVIEIRYQAPASKTDPAANLRHRLAEKQKLLDRSTQEAEALSKKQTKLKERIDLHTGNSRTSSELLRASRQVRQLEEKEFLIRQRSLHATGEEHYRLADELKQCKAELARARGDRLAKLAGIQGSKAEPLVQSFEQWEKEMLGKRKNIAGNRLEIQRLQEAIRETLGETDASLSRGLSSKTVTALETLQLEKGQSLERTLEILKSQGATPDEIRVWNRTNLRQAAQAGLSKKAFIVVAVIATGAAAWKWIDTERKLKDLEEDLKNPSSTSSLPSVYTPSSRSGAVE